MNRLFVGVGAAFLVFCTVLPRTAGASILATFTRVSDTVGHVTLEGSFDYSPFWATWGPIQRTSRVSFPMACSAWPTSVDLSNSTVVTSQGYTLVSGTWMALDYYAYEPSNVSNGWHNTFLLYFSGNNSAYDTVSGSVDITLVAGEWAPTNTSWNMYYGYDSTATPCVVTGTYSIVDVPEPMTLAVLGAAGLILLKRRGLSS
ncbi:MAG: PEP-CTERM sorting domain-containing protein [Planctomycetaceae bacterium]